MGSSGIQHNSGQMLSFSTLGLPIMLGSFLAFHVFSRLVKWWKSTCSINSEWIWRSFFIAWFHSGLISILNITCFYLYWDEVTADLVGYSNLTMYCMLAFTTGYFCYDFSDVCMNCGLLPMWEVILHHISVISIFVYNLFTCKCVGYSMVALVVEFNTFFLHSRKLLQKHPVPFDHWLYRIMVWANIFTFVFCRFAPLAMLCHGIYVLNIGDLVSKAYLGVLSTSILIMIIINPILFYRIIKNDVIRYHFGPSSSKKQKTQGEEPEKKANENNNKDSHLNNGASVGHHNEDSGLTHRAKTSG